MANPVSTQDMEKDIARLEKKLNKRQRKANKTRDKLEKMRVVRSAAYRADSSLSNPASS